MFYNIGPWLTAESFAANIPITTNLAKKDVTGIPKCQCYKTLFLSNWQSDQISWRQHFLPGIIFEGKARSLPYRGHLRCPTWVCSSLTGECKTWLKRLYRCKCSSLLGFLLSDEDKKGFITLTIDVNVIKPFYSHWQSGHSLTNTTLKRLS